MNKNKVGIWAAVIIVVLVVIVAVTVTLVLVLKKHDKHKSQETQGPSLDDRITNNSSFPDGTYKISAKSLKPGLVEAAPLLVNISMLNYLGLRVDNSSLIAEAGRLSYFFIRLPPDNARAKRELSNDEDESIGIRFGNSDTINVVPLNLSMTEKSGLSLLGALEDKSKVYQLEVRIGNVVCSSNAVDSCSIVKWTAYSLASADTGSQANFTNQLPVACGSQCYMNATSPCATSCSTCDGQQVAGADTPVTRRYKMGKVNAKNLQFKYNTYVVKDRITVTYKGEKLFDSGCVGTEADKIFPLNFEGDEVEIRVDVEPNCEGTSGTAWDFTLPCPDCKHGIDVSHYQKVVDWHQVIKTSISFAIAKATDGTKKDEYFLENWAEIAELGITAMAYHYFRGKESVDEQYNNIILTLFNGPVYFNPHLHLFAVDLEGAYNDGVSKDTMAKNLWDLMTKLSSRIDQLYIYTGPNVWKERVEWKNYAFQKYPLWISDYRKRKEPEVPMPWKDWTIWQYSETGNVQGVNGNVDLDKWKC